MGAGAGRPEGVGEGQSRAGKTGKVLAFCVHHGGRWGWAGAESGSTSASGRQGGPCEEAAPNAQKGLPVTKPSVLVIKGLLAPCPEPGPEFPSTFVLSKSSTKQGP